VEAQGKLTLINFGTVAGQQHSIFAFNSTSITNAGTLSGNVELGAAADSFNDFMRIGNTIKSGTVAGIIDLGDGADQFNGGAGPKLCATAAEPTRSHSVRATTVTIAVSSGGIDGADRIAAGPGSDTYDASAAANSVIVNLDSRVHFAFAGLSASGADIGNDHITSFENAIGGSNHDELFGTSGANRLVGGGGTGRYQRPRRPRHIEWRL